MFLQKGTAKVRKCCSFEKEQQKCTIIKCKHAKNELVVHYIDAEDGPQFEGSNT